MKPTWMSRSLHGLALLAVLLLPLVSALLLAAPAHAAGDTLTLSITNGTSFTYGGTQPKFTAVVTFGTRPSANYFWSVSVQLDGTGQTFSNVNNPTTSPDGMTLTFTGLEPFDPVAAGQHSAVARFFNPGTSTTVYSAPVNFTINKATVPLACSIDGPDAQVHFLGANQTLHIQMMPYVGSGQLPSEWQQGTYTVTFDGPTHITNSNLVSDSNAVVTMTSPVQFGMYTLTCAFNGSASYTPSTFTDHIQYTVSEQHALGSAQLFTNPTTLKAGQETDFYLVLHAAPGLPIPTGDFQIWIGPYYTKAIPLTAAGDCLVHGTGISSLSGISQITIRYWGDTRYNTATINFPLTNPPIPGSAGSGGTTGGSFGGGSSGGSPQATTTAQATPNGTATATSDATAPVAVDAGNVPPITVPGARSSGAPVLLIVLAALGLAILGAGAIAIVYLRRRAKLPQGYGGPAADAFPTQSPLSQSSGLGNDDTFPYSPGDY